MNGSSSTDVGADVTPAMKQTMRVALDNAARAGDTCARSILAALAAREPDAERRMVFWYADEASPDPVPGERYGEGVAGDPRAAGAHAHAHGFMPSPDQRAGFATVTARLCSDDPDSQVTVLTGPAGSGKTTILRMILAHVKARGKRVAVFAPTGKATRRVGDATGEQARTVHSGLYRRVFEDENGKPVFSEPGRMGEEINANVIVIDEGSMIGTVVAGHILGKIGDARLLVVGDGAQIPPVKDTWGFPMRTPHAQLTTVHRQAMESPILAFATEARQGRGWAFLQDWVARGQPDNRLCVCSGDASTVARALGDLVRALPDGHRDPDDGAAITWMNKNRKQINQACRAALAPDATSWFDTGMPVLIRENKHDFGLLNGEVVRVEHAEHGSMATRCALGGTRHLFLVESLLYATSREWSDTLYPKGFGESGPAFAKRAVRADPGYCLTVHASQGSQWPVVVFYLDGFLAKRWRAGNDEARRLIYTAATRASERLVIVMGS